MVVERDLLVVAASCCVLVEEEEEEWSCPVIKKTIDSVLKPDNHRVAEYAIQRCSIRQSLLAQLNITSSYCSSVNKLL